MTFTVIFAADFATARRYVGDHCLQPGKWQYVHHRSRLPRAKPEECETVCLPGWKANEHVVAAHELWEQRRADTA